MQDINREVLNNEDALEYEIGNLLFGHSRGNFPVPREPYQKMFNEFLTRNGFDMYGYIESRELEKYSIEDGRCFGNDVFIIRPYYWGDDDSIFDLPNFEYKPTGFKLSWYKYPMRDSHSNMKINEQLMREMLAECENSLK